MSSAPSDRNLLFGVLALQMDFISGEALLSALRAWVFDKSHSLGAILVGQGALQASQRSLLEPLVDAHLALHGHDAEKSLAAVVLSTPLRRELQSIVDADVQTSLSRLPTPARPGEPGLLTSTTAEIHRVGESRYHILRPHDKGGIGEVFVARDEELNREVALKEIQEEHAGDAPSVGRFVREAEITGGLEHPGIVPVYGLGQYADGRPYYAMRFIRGETLKDAIRKHHAGQAEWTLRGLLMRFVTVCNTLAYAHSRGVIHRDIKPANIMLGQYGETLVVDWGMAKAATTEQARSASDGLPEPTLVPRLADSIETQAGSAMGTPAYMSPEQASGRLDLLGPASDIYSLGATLYTLLTGRPPIEGKDTAEVLRKAQKGEWLPVRQVKADAPRALAAICHKAMALAPSARYGTALELAADVEHWLADEPVAAHRESLLGRSRRWMRRHRTLVSTTVGVLVVALVGTTVGLVFVNQAWDSESAARKTAQDKEAETTQQKEEADRQRDKARFNQYVAEMNLVQREYETGNLGRVRELLTAQVPRAEDMIDLRGFEWHYWQHMANRELLILQGHTGVVARVAYSPDGRWLASASVDETVRVWDAATGKERLTLKGHKGYVNDVAFSPDGRWLASAGQDQTVRVWNVATGKELRKLQGHTAVVFDVSFSPDGRWLASASADATVRVWDASTGRMLQRLLGSTDTVRGVSFSPDGRWLASAGSQTIRVWDVSTGRLLRTLQGHTSVVAGVAFSPDGLRLASASWDKTVRIWDAVTGQELRTLQGHSGSVTSVSFSPDGRRLASTGDRTLRVWDAASGQALFTLKGHTFGPWGVSFSPDGRRLASAGDQTVRVWTASPGQELLTLKGHTGIRCGVAFSPDGRRLASAGWDQTVRVWDLATGKELRKLRGHLGMVQGVAFSPDGRWLASASLDQTLRLWDVETGQDLRKFQGHTSLVVGVAFSPDGRRLASACWDQTVRLWDAATGQELRKFQGHTGLVVGVAFSSDGRRLASASEDQTIRVWDAATGQELRTLKGHTHGVKAVSFSPDGRWLASAGDQTIRVWDAATGQELRTLKGHTIWVSDVTFSVDGRRLASVSEDQTVRIWDAASGQELLTLKGHTSPVYGVAFSSDGRRLASASSDGTVRVWETLAVTESVARRRDLVSRVSSLIEELLLREEVLAALCPDPTLDADDWKFIQQLVQSHAEDPQSWNQAAWNVVRYRNNHPDDYIRALYQAEAALRLVPKDSNLLNTLGVAQYRVGRHADALATLTQSEKLNATQEGSLPSDLAFLALTQHQLGKKDEAKTTLDRLRKAMKQPRWAKDAESMDFLREAEELIEGGTNKKP